MYSEKKKSIWFLFRSFGNFIQFKKKIHLICTRNNKLFLFTFKKKYKKLELFKWSESTKHALRIRRNSIIALLILKINLPGVGAGELRILHEQYLHRYSSLKQLDYYYYYTNEQSLDHKFLSHCLLVVSPSRLTESSCV